MLRPDSQPLTCFEAGQCIQFQSRSDLNWLAVLTELVYKLELHVATVIDTILRWQRRWRSAILWELEGDYTWREAMLSLECTFKARARLHWGQLCWRIANYSVFTLCWQCRCSTGNSGSPPVFHECTSYSRALDCTGSSGMHLRQLLPHSTAIMLSCKLTMYSCNAPHAHMLRNLVLLRCSAMLPL